MKAEPVEVIKMPKLKRIPYFSRPPQQGDVPQYLSHEEFKQKFRCEYSESVFCADPSLLFDDMAISEETMKLPFEVDKENFDRGLLSIVTQAYSKLAIAFIDDKVGYGLFALEDIPEETVLCFYNGIMRREHEMSKDNDDVYFSEVVPGCVISPAENRGLAAFMQHLPSRYESDYVRLLTELLKKRMAGTNASDDLIVSTAKKRAIELRVDEPEFDTLQFDESAKKDSCAVSNVRRVRTFIENIPVVVIQSTDRIPQYRQVGYPYAVKEYWDELGTIPELFDEKSGNVIPRNLYTRRDVNWDAHNGLVEKLREFASDCNELTVWNFICQFNYNAALRNSCLIQDNDRAVMFVKTILAYREVLGINIDEKAASAGLAPIHCAAKVGNRDAMAVLERAGVDMTQKTKGEETVEQLLAKYDAEVLSAKQDQQSLVDFKAREEKVKAAKAKVKSVTSDQAQATTKQQRVVK